MLSDRFLPVPPEFEEPEQPEEVLTLPDIQRQIAAERREARAVARQQLRELRARQRQMDATRRRDDARAFDLAVRRQIAADWGAAIGLLVIVAILCAATWSLAASLDKPAPVAVDFGR